MTLLEMLLQVPDHRSAAGRRHELSDVLMMCIMGIMSGYFGYRELGRFVERHHRDFQQSFRLLHHVPTFVTIRSILQDVDFKSFNKVFVTWAEQYVSFCKSDTLAIDGKAIGSTISNYDQAYQNFVSLISIFSVQRGIVLSVGKIENKKESEIPTVQDLIKALDVKGEIFTIDALHCQKKRQLILESQETTISFK